MAGKPGCGRKPVDQKGKRFGRLVVLERSNTIGDGPVRWRCRCDCGTEKIAVAGELTRGRVRSCGCLQRESMARANRKHGHVGTGNGTPEYNAWCQMRKRCYDPKHISYRNYGARGITVCDAWQIFENFYADMGPRPSRRHSLDRIASNGNYEPQNCRWATVQEQARNKRTTKVDEAAVRAIRSLAPSHTHQALADRFGVTRQAISKIVAHKRWADVQ